MYLTLSLHPRVTSFRIHQVSSHHNDTSYLSLSLLSLDARKKVKSTGLNALRKVRCGTAFPAPFVSGETVKFAKPELE